MIRKWTGATVIILLIASVAVLFVSRLINQTPRLVFSCLGDYSSEIDFPQEKITGASDISFNVFSDGRLLVAMDGHVRDHGADYHISREIWYRYQVVDAKQGLIRASVTSVNRSEADTAADHTVSTFMLGAVPGGRTYQFRNLNGNVYLIGNIYAPVLSCVRTDS